MSALRPFRLLLSVVVCSPWFLHPSALAIDKLEIGSAAPKLSVEHWIQKGNGKFSEVTQFEKGRVYVIEFWATTCGPCVQSMPHLAELQTKFADKGLQIVSISNEPLKAVTSFLQNRIRLPNGQESTIDEVTKGYCLTTDPDGSSEIDYLLAAEQDSIPSAFVVGKDGKIEWIGHPMEMEPIVEAVLQDRWDRASYMADQKLLQEARTTVRLLARNKQFLQAAEAIDGFITRTKEKRLVFGLHKSKIDMLILGNADSTTLEQSHKQLFDLYRDEPLFVQDVAWGVFERYASGDLDNKGIVSLAADAVEKSLAKSTGAEKANMFDTLARLQHALERIDLAIAAQTNAVQLSDGSDQGAFKDFLNELIAEKANK
jgi:thiol-disulfide isomerase/thioredoxin